jgi:hypothetical protein
MPTHYDKKTDRWTATHDIYPITVCGPKRNLCEERLADLVSRYENVLRERATDYSYREESC